MTDNASAAPAAKVPAARFGGKGLNIGIVVAAVVTVAGLALWGMQLSGGLVQTGMRNFDSWGLYISVSGGSTDKPDKVGRYTQIFNTEGAVRRVRCESPSLNGGSAPGTGGLECGRGLYSI